MIVQRSGFRVIVRDIGGLQVLLAGAMGAPLAISVLYREWYSALGFAISVALIAGLGGVAFRVCRHAGEPRGYHAMLIAGAGWLVSALLGGMSTCGWQTSNIGAWRDPGILLVVWGAMLVGGAAGSTVGGIKLIRSYIIFRAVSWRIKRVFLPPEAVVPFKVGERTVPAQDIQREIADAAVFVFLYMAIFVVGMLVTASFVGPQFTLADAMFEAMSAQTGSGLSTGIVDPGMPAPVEVTFILLMWIGRLEIFPVIILLRALLVWHRRSARRG